MNSGLYQDGNYKVRVTRQTLEHARSTDTIQLVLAMCVLGRYDDDNNLVACPIGTRHLRHSINSHAACFRLRADLMCLGYTLQRLTQFLPRRPDSIFLVGREIDVACEVEMFEGRPQERWSLRRRRLATASAVEQLAFLGETFAGFPGVLREISTDAPGAAEEAPATEAAGAVS